MTSAQRDAPAQLVLDLPHRAAFGAEDFFVSQSNANAVAFIDGWPGWPKQSAVLCGPLGSGKTHLCSVWRTKSRAGSVSAAKLSDSDLTVLEDRHALVVEDIDQGISDEKLLFHALNLSREKSASLLLTCETPPGDIPINLPDLRSRLRGLPLVAIDTPDEALLKAVLIKLFSDRQLAVEPHVIAHIALHMDRSMETAGRVVAAADRLALAKQRRVTRAVAADALAEINKPA